MMNNIRKIWRKLPFKLRNQSLIRKIIQLIVALEFLQTRIRNAKKSNEYFANILTQHGHQKLVVVYPTYDWKIPLMQRPQHMAMEFAKNGYLVIFCTKNHYDRIFGFEKIQENLYLTNHYKIVVQKADVLITYATDPNLSKRRFAHSAKNPRIVLYDYLDEMHAALNGKPTKKIARRHLDILQNEKVIVLASSKVLVEKAKSAAPQAKVLYIPNACSYEHWSKSRSSTASHIIGYFGAIASWFDYDLLKAVCKNFPEYEIQVIGLDYDKSEANESLDKFENLKRIDPIPYLELPDKIDFEIGIIPFKVNEITLATSPIKVFEYLAMGIPVVTTNLPECADLPGVFLSKNAEEFINNVKYAIESAKDSEKFSDRQKFASQQTWSSRVLEIINSIQLENHK